MTQRTQSSTSRPQATIADEEDDVYAVDVDDPILVEINRKLDSRVHFVESEHVTSTGVVVRVLPGGRYRGVCSD